MFRVINLEQEPWVDGGPPDETGAPTERVLPASIRALPEEVVAIIDSTGEGADIDACSCGARVGHVLDDSDDCHPVVRWGIYTVWSDGEGLFRVLCEDCSQGVEQVAS